MMALKRANPEDSPTFFAVRGKKNVLKPNSLFGALSGKRFTRSMKPNSLFSAIPGRRSPMGKRSMKPNSLFSAIPAGKRGGLTSLKPNSLFGSFSKRSIKPNGLFGLRVQRDTEPMDLFSVGKKNSFLVCGPEDTRCPFSKFSLKLPSNECCRKTLSRMPLFHFPLLTAMYIFS